MALRAPAPLLFIALLAALPARAQDAPAPHDAPAKAWVLFTDTGDEPPPPVAVTERAAERRARRARTRRADLDRPVATAYLAALRGLGVEPLVQSRWLNGVSAHLTPEQQAAVAALPFVRAVRPVAAARAEQAAPAPRSPVRLDFGPSALQLTTINADLPLGMLRFGLDGFQPACRLRRSI